jgi:hypothetical protein
MMRRVLFKLLALIAFLSCSSEMPTERNVFSGDFALESINGQPLPFIDFLAPLTGDSLFITAGDLSVLSRGRVRIVRHSQWRPRNAPAMPVTTDTTVNAYEIEGDYAYIHYPTGGLQGAYSDTLEIFDNSLIIRQLVNRHNLGHFWRNLLFVKRQ